MYQVGAFALLGQYNGTNCRGTRRSTRTRS